MVSVMPRRSLEFSKDDSREVRRQKVFRVSLRSEIDEYIACEKYHMFYAKGLLGSDIATLLDWCGGMEGAW
jgi:hypothetical protein